MDEGEGGVLVSRPAIDDGIKELGTRDKNLPRHSSFDRMPPPSDFHDPFASYYFCE